VARYCAYALEYSGIYKMPHGFESRPEEERKRMLIMLTRHCNRIHDLEADLEDFGLPDQLTSVKITEYLCRLSAAIESNNGGRKFISALSDDEGNGKTRLLIRAALFTLKHGYVPNWYAEAYQKLSHAMRRDLEAGDPARGIDKLVEQLCERFGFQDTKLSEFKSDVARLLGEKQAAADAAEMEKVEEDIQSVVNHVLACYGCVLKPLRDIH